MTTPDQLALNAGTNIRHVARHWPTYRPGLREKQVRHRINRIRSAMRHGGLNRSAALRLADLLGCNPLIFLHGLQYHLDSMRNARQRGESSLEGLAEQTRNAGGQRVNDTASGAATEKPFHYPPLRDVRRR